MHSGSESPGLPEANFPNCRYNTSESNIKDTIKDLAVDFLTKLRLLSFFIFIVFLKRLSLI